MTSFSQQPKIDATNYSGGPSNRNDVGECSKFCRICGNNNNPLIHLFGQEAIHTFLVQKINKYLPIVVDRHDNLPLEICRPCASAVLSWHNLVQCCEKTEKVLTSKLNPTTHNNSNNVNSKQVTDETTARNDDTYASTVGNSEKEIVSETEDAPKENRGEADGGEENIERPKTIVIENGKRYGVCGVCDKRVATASWRRHARSHAAARYRCHVCGRGFSDGGNLARHARALHRRARPHACPLCARRFSRAAHLRDHVAAHSERRDHVCDACGHASKSAAALRMHRRVHDERLRFRCARCGAAFKRAGQLAAHASVHSPSRDHLCACGRAFRLKTQLAAHARRHERDAAAAAAL